MGKKVLLVVVLMLLLVACSPVRKINHLERTNEKFEVDTKAKTIRNNEVCYTYEVEGNTTTITYPNGGVYWWITKGNSGYGGWNEQYDSETYLAGSILLDVVEATRTPSLSALPLDKIGVTGVLIMLGLLSLFHPISTWRLRELQGYRRREPFAIEVIAMCINGIIILLLALAMWN